MKIIFKTLISVLVASALLITLSACKNDIPGDSSSETSTPESSTPSSEIVSQPTSSTEFSEPSSASSEPTEPIDTGSTSLTFDEATEICRTWLDSHPELSPYKIHLWEEYESYSYEISPTFEFLGTAYYEFYVRYGDDESEDSSHTILVQENTGKLLSLSNAKTENEHAYTILDSLDNWYNGEHPLSASSSLTPDEAVDIYEAWLAERYEEDSAEFSSLLLNRESYGYYILLGEEYYHFNAADDFMYYHNVLIHVETGELLYLMTSDGMYPTTSIELLDDWYDSFH